MTSVANRNIAVRIVGDNKPSPFALLINNQEGRLYLIVTSRGRVVAYYKNNFTDIMNYYRERNNTRTN